MLIKIRESVITKPTLHQKNVIRIDLLILSSPGMLLCATKLFVEVCDNLPAHTHTPSHRFICLISAQGCNQWHQLHKSKPWWGELQGKLKNLNMAKKNWKNNKEKQNKKFLMKRIEGVGDCYHERNNGYQRQDFKRWYGVSMVCKTNSVVKMKMEIITDLA